MSYSRFIKTFLSSCLREEGYLSRIVPLLEPGVFSADPRAHWLTRFLKDYWNEYKDVPSREVVLLEVARDYEIPDEMRSQIIMFIDSLYSMGLDDKDYALDLIAEELIRYKLFQDTLMLKQMIEAEVGVTQLQKHIRHMLSYTQEVSMDTGIDFEASLDNLHEIADQFKNRIPTGFPILDSYLLGGMPRGTELILCSTPKAGKSFFLINIALNAFFNGYKVIYFTLELPEPEIRQRMIQVAGQVSYDAIISVESDNIILRKAAERIKQRISKLRSGGDKSNYLRIKEYPTYKATASHFDAFIHMMEEPPDIIVVDYAELVRPIVSSREKRHSLGQVVLEMRGLAGEYDAVVYTAWQANRESLNQNLIHEGNLSESWEPAKHTDVLLTLTEDSDEDDAFFDNLAGGGSPYASYKLFIALSRIGGRQKVTLNLRRNRGTGAMEILGEDEII